MEQSLSEMKGLTMRKLALGAAVLALIAGSVSITHAAPLTLKQCIAEAVRNSPQLAAARHDIAAAIYEITKKRGTTLPYLSGKLNAYEVNGSAVTPFSTLHSFSPESPSKQAHFGPVAGQSVGMTYPLYEYGSIMGLNNPPVVAAARAALEQAQSIARLYEQKVILDATAMFSYAVWYRDELPLDEEMVKLSEKQLEIVREQVSLGLRLPQDVELARAQLGASQQAIASARQNADDAILQLAKLMGHEEDERLEPENTKPPLPRLPSLREFFAKVMPGHPALHVQQDKVEIAKQQYRVDRSTLLPSLSLNTIFQAAQNLAHFNGGTGHLNPTAFLSYIQVDIPIFDFGQRRAAVHQSEEKVLSEQERVKQIDLDLRSAITESSRQIYDIDEKLAALRSDYLKASNDVLLARAQRKEGLIDELKLVESELALLYARSSLESEKQMKQLKYAELQNLSGGTWRWMQ